MTQLVGLCTRQSLSSDLVDLGLRHGDTVLVHSSLRSLGWVCGGAVSVVHALLDVIGATGTLVVYAQTVDNKDPGRWSPPVPEAWWSLVRANLPAFDASLTPCLEMGLVAETVRTWPGAVRSRHPQTSFVAVGPRASELMAIHDLGSELGERSPLAALERADARVLLLGVGFDKCTAFHLAEYRNFPMRRKMNACAILVDGLRHWIEYLGNELDSSRFAELGAEFARSTDSVRVGEVGRALARLFPLRDAVSFAKNWLAEDR